MPRPIPIGIRREVLALAREGMRQSDIAGPEGLTRVTVNSIPGRHSATGTLVPGKSTGPPQKTTPRQDYALLKMVRQDRFISARALMVRMRNLYGIRAGRKPSTTGSCPVVTLPIDPPGSPCWLPTIAVSTWSGHRGGRTWQWPPSKWNVFYCITEIGAHKPRFHAPFTMDTTRERIMSDVYFQCIDISHPVFCIYVNLW